MSIILGILEQGLIYSLLALGLYISFSILNMPDMTVEGSFPLGCAISSLAVLSGLHPALALLLCFLGGLAAGALTGIMHVKFHIVDFFSGMITATALYTINLLIVGKANLALFDNPSIFKQGLLARLFPPSLGEAQTSLVVLPIVLLVKWLLDGFLNTQAGFLLKAAGDNPSLVKTLGKDPGRQVTLGLALGNGLAALSGGLLCQQQRFFEVSVGSGSMMVGLASVVIGLRLFPRFSKMKDTSRVILGSLLYKAIIALAIALGLPAVAMKLVTAILFFLVLLLSQGKAGRQKGGENDSI